MRSWSGSFGQPLRGPASGHNLGREDDPEQTGNHVSLNLCITVLNEVKNKTHPFCFSFVQWGGLWRAVWRQRRPTLSVCPAAQRCKCELDLDPAEHEHTCRPFHCPHQNWKRTQWSHPTLNVMSWSHLLLIWLTDCTPPWRRRRKPSFKSQTAGQENEHCIQTTKLRFCWMTTNCFCEAFIVEVFRGGSWRTGGGDTIIDEGIKTKVSVFVVLTGSRGLEVWWTVCSLTLSWNTSHLLNRWLHAESFSVLYYCGSFVFHLAYKGAKNDCTGCKTLCVVGWWAPRHRRIWKSAH